MTAPGQAGRRGEGWISVEESIPDAEDRVIFVTEDGEQFVGRNRHEGGEWWEARTIFTHKVTHWMPLPAPPVADGEEGEDV